MSNFPPDVLVLDSTSLVHARLAPAKPGLRLERAKGYRLAADTFTSSVVTPELTNEASLADTLRRLRMETGKWDRGSVLLPDSWFRINIVDLPSLPDKPGEAMEVVRWSLKRTLPIAPEELRVTYEVLAKAGDGAKVLVLSALEKTLAAIERTFAAAGIAVILIEPIGLNIWNAIAVREAETAKDRLFVYVRDTDFTTAVFRGSRPLFIRSRNLSGERTVAQELKLSATYVRETLRADAIEKTYLAGNSVDGSVRDALGEEFGAPVQPVSLRELVKETPADIYGIEAELAACAGVFTA